MSISQGGPASDMTMRDYFASCIAQSSEPPTFYVGREETEKSLRNWANDIWRMADALIAERGKEPRK